MVQGQKKSLCGRKTKRPKPPKLAESLAEVFGRPDLQTR